MTTSQIRILDHRTADERGRDFLPGMGKPWLMPFYDLFGRLAGVRLLHERAVRAAGIQPGQQVLDVGGGTGNLSFAVLRAVPDARVSVLDPDGAALRRAARKAGSRGRSLTLIQGFADRLPVDDGSLDHVVTALALHHLDEDGRSAFACEAHRALRPGGKVTIVDFGRPASSGGGDHGHGHDHHRRHGILRSLRKRTSQGQRLARNLGNGLVDLLTEGGFTEVREVDHIDHRFGPVTVVQAAR